MPQTRLSKIEDTLDLMLDARQAHIAMAGGTAVVWAEASNGAVICVTDGDHEGHPFDPYDGKVLVEKYFVGVYSSEESYLDGDMYIDHEVIPADLPTLAAAARRLAEITD